VTVPRDGSSGAYVFARWGNQRVVINAHVDTVPPNAGWSRDPYTPVVDAERVWGLGACDTKGAIAVAICALEAGTPRDVAVLFTGDEELNGTCMRVFLASESARSIRRVVVCEPTGCRVGTRHRGVMSMEVRVHGHGGHSSNADHMPAPIADLARCAVAIADWGIARRDQGPLGFKGMCVNIAGIDGGVAFNVVPEQAVLTVSLRPPPGFQNAPLIAELTALIHQHAPTATVTTPVDNDPFEIDARPFCEAFGWDPAAVIDLAFWTEAALLSAASIDAVVYGPGEIDHAHAPDESVELSQLAQAYNTLHTLIHGTG
jgi:acetylornithine deacetylase